MDSKQALERREAYWELIISRLLPIVLALLVARPVLLHPTWWIWKPGSPASDLAVTHWPNAHFTRRMLWDEGAFPLWRPTIMSGSPFAANPLAALYYAPNWLLLFLPSALTAFPLTLGFNLSAVVHLALAGVTMYALMRRGFGTGFWGGMVATVAYQASPKVLAHLGAGHVGWVQAWPWLPLIVLCTMNACRSKPHQATVWALWMGLALAVQFCADVRLSAYTLMAAASLVLAGTIGRVVRRRTTTNDSQEDVGTVVRGRASSLARIAVLSLAVFVGLAACQWLPGLALLPETTRSAMSMSDAASWSLPWRYLSGLLLADHGGFQEWMTYVGVSTLVLAWTGGKALWRDHHRRWLVIWLVGLGGFAAWFSLGKHGALFQVLWHIVPGLGLLRVPPRAWVLVAFTTAVLAGLGLEDVRHQRGRRSTRSKRWKRALVLGTAAFPPMFAIAYQLTTGKSELNLSMFGLITPLTIALCSVPARIQDFASSSDAGHASRTRRMRGTALGQVTRSAAWLGFVGTLLVAVDLLVVDSTLIETRSPEEVFTPGRAAAEWLADEPARFRVYSPSYSLPQHVAERYALELADGVDPLQLQPYAEYLTRAAGLQSRPGYSVTLPPFPEDSDVRTALADTTPNTEMLGQLGVRYIAAAFPIPHSRLDLIGRFDDVYIYRNEDARELTTDPSVPRIVLADGKVLFEYRPKAVYGGWVLSGVTLMSVVMALWWVGRCPAAT